MVKKEKDVLILYYVICKKFFFIVLNWKDFEIFYGVSVLELIGIMDYSGIRFFDCDIF